MSNSTWDFAWDLLNGLEEIIVITIRDPKRVDKAMNVVAELKEELERIAEQEDQ